MTDVITGKSILDLAKGFVSTNPDGLDHILMEVPENFSPEKENVIMFPIADRDAFNKIWDQFTKSQGKISKEDLILLIKNNISSLEETKAKDWANLFCHFRKLGSNWFVAAKTLQPVKNGVFWIDDSVGGRIKIE